MCPSLKSLVLLQKRFDRLFTNCLIVAVCLQLTVMHNFVFWFIESRLSAFQQLVYLVFGASGMSNNSVGDPVKSIHDSANYYYKAWLTNDSSGVFHVS